MVSVRPPLDQLGARDEPISVPYGGGMPRATTDLTRAVPFNDADALEGALARSRARWPASSSSPR